MSFPRLGCACIVIRGSEILLGVSNKKPIEDKWVIPGGGVKEYERIEVTAVREFREETGLNITPLELLFAHEIIDEANFDHRVVLVFEARYDEGFPRAGSDLKHVAWVDFRDMGKYQNHMTDATLEILHKLSIVLRNRASIARNAQFSQIR